MHLVHVLAMEGALLVKAGAHTCKASQVARSISIFLPGRRGDWQKNYLLLLWSDCQREVQTSWQKVLLFFLRELREEVNKPASKEEYLSWTGDTSRNTRPIKLNTCLVHKSSHFLPFTHGICTVITKLSPFHPMHINGIY